MSQQNKSWNDVLEADCLELSFKRYSLRITLSTDSIKWIAKDVLLALHLTDTDLSKVPTKFKDLLLVHKYRNGKPLLWKERVETVNQCGLEYLISLANKQTGLEFQKWYYEEALLSIRKTA